MPTHAERRKLPYTPEQLFDLVADIDSYSEFLPWCVASRVRKRNGDVLHADLVIGFKMFREKYTSKVTLQRPDRVDVEYLQGPFKYLNNHWVFEPAEDGGTWLDFFVDFEFRSALLQKMIGVVFNEAVKLMVGAFETRAHQVYGEPNSSTPSSS
ncbi:type II toxin-antitoxin system RatA family toxin [Thalassospira xianhensis]|uniref:Cyclase n=1 Tax=Thalassospira xianhensis MCCC 1A02616 TaxID=1177929 RepID=A0A367UFX2_9PROT|nr:type II toxin-antitoxin system RatA family toxin [Thalassospira xianhensis]RCK06921.1 cyclase [Thalassospira xianhensis MCCC 1A02616]UKV16681.1 type II toxin-antitoxin system RatA family toxin [Thalassospiraceae bacterium SW-3-3]